MAGERKRIEEIKQRQRQRERERMRKIYMLRRCMLLAIAIGLILAIVFGIKGCVNSIQQKKIDEEARVAAEQAALAAQATPAPKLDANGIDQTFYANSVFVGNSFIDGMLTYDLIPGADYFSKVGLNVSEVMTETTDMGTVPIIDELNSDTKYDKVFLMFGENEVGWVGDAFFEQYKKVIDKVKLYQPQAKIYLMGITAISKEVSDQEIDGLSVDKIKAYNSKMKTLAQNNGVIYADLYSATSDADGYLPENTATDGIHFGKDCYIKSLKYMQENCI